MELIISSSWIHLLMFEWIAGLSSSGNILKKMLKNDQLTNSQTSSVYLQTRQTKASNSFGFFLKKLHYWCHSELFCVHTCASVLRRRLISRTSENTCVSNAGSCHTAIIMLQEWISWPSWYRQSSLKSCSSVIYSLLDWNFTYKSQIFDREEIFFWSQWGTWCVCGLKVMGWKFQLQ